MQLHLGVVLLSLATSYAALVKDPKTLCSFSEKNFDKCLTGNVQKMIPYMTKGIPKFNVPPIEPLRISELNVAPAQGRTINVKHKFSNVDIFNIPTSTVKRARFDRKNVELVVDLEFQKPMRMTGDYVTQGKILAFPMNGSGKFTINMQNFKVHLRFKGHEEKRGGKTYYKIDTAQVQASTSKLNVDFKDLFKGNKQISEELNRTLNENWQPVLEDVKPAFERGLAEAFKQIGNAILAKVPHEDLFRN